MKSTYYSIVAGFALGLIIGMVPLAFWPYFAAVLAAAFVARHMAKGFIKGLRNGENR